MNRSKQNILQRIWNIELGNNHLPLGKGVFIVVFIIGLFYVLAEVLFGQIGATSKFSVLNHSEWATTILENTNNSWLELHFGKLWLGLAIFCVIVRMTIIVSSYIKSKEIFGEKKFAKFFLNYSMSFFVGFGSGMLLLLAINKTFQFFGIMDSANIFSLLALKIKAFFNSSIPNIIQIDSYYLAFAISIFLVSLPNYFVHCLSHKSRFVWYVFHRAHHCPEILHPMAAPPAFVFDFFLIIPSVLVGASVSRLIHSETLFLEMSIWFLLGYILEIFNHSSVHYDFAYKNPIVRNLSRLFGDKGVYHLVHHSAFKQDQEVNFSGAPFNFWDRLFGTYRKPYETIPDLGLTDQPKLRLNPFRIIFSGIFQLIYEFFHNKGLKSKLKILFGPIHYQPQHSKDYLIVKNKEHHK